MEHLVLELLPPGGRATRLRRIWRVRYDHRQNGQRIRRKIKIGDTSSALSVIDARWREIKSATEQLIKISKDILRIIRLQLQAGQVSGLDVASQEALVAQTEATLPPLRKALAQQRDQLIVLTGHLPGEGRWRLSRLRRTVFPTRSLCSPRSAAAGGTGSCRRPRPSLRPGSPASSAPSLVRVRTL